MKEFLYLYPIAPYLNSIIGENEMRIPHHERLVGKLNRIVDKRYRQRGFGINWVLFSQENELDKPDISQKAPEIVFDKSDRILSAGISFSLLVEKRLYPDTDYILNQIPDLEVLRVGGFHQWDCVDKIASYAYAGGIDVRVDEDTTDLFFLSGRSGLSVPLVRDTEYISKRVMGGFDDFARAKRSEKPWFAQIST